mmetsp:Transcript_17666/g.42376  ORF Transcript_17666/g.42376 Transcript_17666/m.42376 type:complete len:250 (+) Transcript_17666:427-1176(+)
MRAGRDARPLDPPGTVVGRPREEAHDPRARVADHERWLGAAVLRAALCGPRQRRRLLRVEQLADPLHGSKPAEVAQDGLDGAPEAALAPAPGRGAVRVHRLERLEGGVHAVLELADRRQQILQGEGVLQLEPRRALPLRSADEGHVLHNRDLPLHVVEPDLVAEADDAKQGDRRESLKGSKQRALHELEELFAACEVDDGDVDGAADQLDVVRNGCRLLLRVARLFRLQQHPLGAALDLDDAILQLREL